MDKIKELEGFGSGKEIATKINELVRAINGLNGQEKEEPIYEVLNPYDCLIISKNEDGALVACNDGKGEIHLKRVKFPCEDIEGGK